MNREDIYKPDCSLCREFQTLGFVDPLGFCSENRSRILVESERIVSLPSLGPLAGLHLLVCPKAHETSLLGASESIRNELLNDVNVWVKSIFEARGSDCVVFEHGASPEGGGNCGVSHCHLHLVETPQKGLPGGVTWQSVDEGTLMTRVAPGKPYLLFKTHPGGWHYTEDVVPSQFLRRQVAGDLGSTDWNWRSDPKYDEMWGCFNQALKVAKLFGRWKMFGPSPTKARLFSR